MIKLCLELSRHFVVFICKHYISSPQQCLEITTLRFISSSFHVSVPMSSTTSHATEYHTQPLKGGILYFSSPFIRQDLSWQARLTDGKLTDVEGYLTHAVVWEGTRINHQTGCHPQPFIPRPCFLYPNRTSCIASKSELPARGQGLKSTSLWGECPPEMITGLSSGNRKHAPGKEEVLRATWGSF